MSICLQVKSSENKYGSDSERSDGEGSSDEGGPAGVRPPSPSGVYRGILEHLRPGETVAGGLKVKGSSILGISLMPLVTSAFRSRNIPEHW